MNNQKKARSAIFSIICAIVLLFIIVYQLAITVIPNYSSYFKPTYTEETYKNLENLFNHSQYRQKENPSIIPDESVFSYAAGAYLKGVDPILINSEHTPLGKYFISLAILLFKNDKLIVIPFAVFTLFVVWLIGKQILVNNILALIPVAIFSSEKLFLGQIIISPLLDIIQLPFVLLTLYFFMKEYKGYRYWLTSLSLGFVIATKSVIIGILLIFVIFVYYLIRKNIYSFLRFAMYLPVALSILVLSYAKTFMDGYTISDFIGFQKWIILYQKSKLIFPFSVWRLIFLNQWQAWWGDMSILKADDWSITWPIFTGLSILLVILLMLKKIRVNNNILILSLWLSVYGVFLSLGVVSSRFLLPFLPVVFILGTYLIDILLNMRFDKAI